jgi:hypothetical protein
LTSPWSRLLLGTLSFVIAAWVLSLVRRGKLYVGYGLPFLVLAAAGAGLALLPTHHPDFVGGVRAASGWLEAALVLAAFGIAAMFIYILSQLTIIAGRTARLAQELALRDAARVTRKAQNESSTPPRRVRAGQPAGRPRS